MQRRCRNVTCEFNLEVQRALMQRALDLAPTARNKVARASRGPRRGSRAGVEVLSDSEARRPWEPTKLNGALKERHSARVQRISISHFQCLRPLTHRSRGVVLRFARTCPWLTYFAPLALEVRTPQSCTSNLNLPFHILPLKKVFASLSCRSSGIRPCHSGLPQLRGIMRSLQSVRSNTCPRTESLKEWSI